MNGPHVTDQVGHCIFCKRNITAANAGTGCPQNIVDLPTKEERRLNMLMNVAATVLTSQTAVGVGVGHNNEDLAIRIALRLEKELRGAL